MRAVVITEPGPPEALSLREVPDPIAGDGEVVIEVVAAGVNRADLLQRQGHYPPPRGAPDWPGLEVSGRVVEVGASVEQWHVGDDVAALLSGGGYAELVAVPAGQVMPVPVGVDLVAAAALPEVACTVWSNVFDVGRLGSGQTLLVHGGGSGIGTHAIQLATARGARVLVTCGSERKAQACRSLGAEVAINYREEDFVEQSLAATGGRGVDVVLDVIGAKYLERNVEVLATGGRLVVIGLQGGVKAELDLRALMSKRASVHGTTLRARPTSEKAAIVQAVVDEVWPLVASGRVLAVVDRIVPWAQAAEAHRAMESGENIGKVLLAVG